MRVHTNTHTPTMWRSWGSLCICVILSLAASGAGPKSQIKIPFNSRGTPSKHRHARLAGQHFERPEARQYVVPHCVVLRAMKLRGGGGPAGKGRLPFDESLVDIVEYLRTSS